MSLKHGLLAFLSEQEMSGYDLEKRFKGSIGHFWSAKMSQVYRDLRTMEKANWVESKQIIQLNKPNKKVFNLTDAGREELNDWLVNYSVKNDFEIRKGILMRLYFAGKIPKEKTISLLENFSDKCHHILKELTVVDQELETCDPSIELLYSRSTLSYGRMYYQMQIEWCKETIEKLKKGSSGF